MPSFFMNLIKSELQRERDEFNLMEDRRQPFGLDRKGRKTRSGSRTISVAKHQTGKTKDKPRDKARKALPPGKRRSASGNIYYEYRANRSDLNGL
jgi:hypothetical protein